MLLLIPRGALIEWIAWIKYLSHVYSKVKDGRANFIIDYYLSYVYTKRVLPKIYSLSSVNPYGFTGEGPFGPTNRPRQYILLISL